MDFDEPTTKKRSLGKLRKAPKTKPRSPDMTGTLLLQRHTAVAILKVFGDDCDEVSCNIAGWRNDDASGPYLTIELSPRYVGQEAQPKTNSLAFIFDSEEA
jgi:hypothetical protein